MKIQRCTFASWSRKMSIIPRCFINLDMAQASTAGTAILGARRDDRKILLWRDRLSQIRETLYHFQILSQPHASLSSANYPLETLDGWTWEQNSSNKKRGQHSLAGGSLINESQKSASTIWEINETQEKKSKQNNQKCLPFLGEKNPLYLFGSFDLEMSRHFTSNFFHTCSCCRGISRGISASFSLGSQEMGANEKGATMLKTSPVIDAPKKDAFLPLFPYCESTCSIRSGPSLRITHWIHWKES